MDQAVVDGPVVAVLGHRHGTNDGPFMGSEPTVRTLDVTGIVVWEFDDDGRIARRTPFRDPGEDLGARWDGRTMVVWDDDRSARCWRWRPCIAYCRGPYCVYADDAVRLLLQRGYRARRLDTGYPEWERAGLPIDHATRPQEESA